MTKSLTNKINKYIEWAGFGPDHYTFEEIPRGDTKICFLNDFYINAFSVVKRRSIDDLVFKRRKYYRIFNPADRAWFAAIKARAQ